MIYFSLLIFAVLPSIIWLLYYFKKDLNPEPKRLVARVFLVGAFFAIIAYCFQITATALLEHIPLFLFVQGFIIVAFSEELFKYLAFFFTVKHHTELDEPMDIIIYMIAAALGFAALENFILFSTMVPAEITAGQMAIISALRFVSATFLHALLSGILGVFLAYGYKFSSKKLVVLGFFAVTVLHGIYNILVKRIEETPALLLLLLLFAFLVLVLSFGIERVKRMKSVCTLK